MHTTAINFMDPNWCFFKKSIFFYFRNSGHKYHFGIFKAPALGQKEVTFCPLKISLFLIKQDFQTNKKMYP
jgi:hypothetical protein